MRAARDGLQHGVDRRVVCDRHHLGPRNHHLPRGQVGEAEDAVQHLLFVFLDYAGFLAGGHEHLQLFFGVHEGVPARPAHAERAHDGAPHAVQKADERPEDPHEQLGGPRHDERGPLGVLQGNRLRRELAEHDVKRGDHGKRDSEGDRVGRGHRHAVAEDPEGGFNDGCECRLADPAEPEARHRDAELRRGDVAVGVGERAPDDARRGAALGDELIDACPPHGHERELGRHEEPVRQHEHQDGKQTDEHMRHVRHTTPVAGLYRTALCRASRSRSRQALRLVKKCASTNSLIAC